MGKNAPPPEVAQHRLILLVLVVVSGFKVMNELNQLTPTSLRDVVVLERVNRPWPPLPRRARPIYRRGNCAEFLSDAHRSRRIWIGSVISWLYCLPAPVATKLGLLSLMSALLLTQERKRGPGEENSDLRSVMIWRPPLLAV